MEENNNFWKTPRGKAIVKLLLWIFFLGIVFIIASSAGTQNIEKKEPKEEVKEQKRFELYNTMIENLLKNNFEYEYKIKIDNTSYVYSGKSDGKNTLGLRENNEGIVKYFINEDGTFRVLLNNIEPLENLYENIDENVINLKTLFETLKSISYKITKEDTTRTVVYDTSSGFEVTVKTDLNNILEIEYKNSTSEYDFVFTSLGQVENVTYNE